MVLITPGRADRYLSGLLDPFVTLLEVHKLMYFMQEAGQPLNLDFVQAAYGPYAQKLRHVLHAIEGYMISGYADGGDAPDKQLQLVPGAIPDAVALLQDDAEAHRRLDRVADLVEGFETPFGLELLSTVHWVVTKMSANSTDEVISKTYGWGDRKRQFNERQIGLALEILAAKGWIQPQSEPLPVN